ncbi:MAG: tRNA (adenosine(37)-N6)-threonylcarbamoyltransferase complex dimerization subunit type 1 TsaB [SAR202 cluster bacterium]|nr:tRNA (adenosine(37)-N6)-threonylcarbamoyltransferase complex dimerization subunit type 1 TsaB [SAR202 cluster bacterium]
MELSIDSSTRYASVCLSREGEALHEISWRADRNHSVELAPAVTRLLGMADAQPADLTAVFAAKGPGGFSALRVGMSLAKSLAKALGVPLVSVGTLEIEAAPYLGRGKPVWAVLEASRKLFYAALFEPDYEGQPVEPLVVDKPTLLKTVQPPAIVCGENVAALRTEFAKGVEAPDAQPPTRKAATLARLAYARLARGESDDPDTLQPVYMRGSQEMVASYRP